MGTSRGRIVVTTLLAVATGMVWVRAGTVQSPDAAGAQLCGDYTQVRDALSGRQLTSMVDLRARAAMLSSTLAHQPTSARPADQATALIDARRRFVDVLRLPNPTARDIWTALRPLGPVCGDTTHWFVIGSATLRLESGG